MSGAALNFVILVILCRKIWSYPTNATLSAMGKSLEAIPPGSPEISSLILGYNNIASLEDNIFTNNSYKSLTTIEIPHNRISAIHSAAFRGLRQLSSVDISFNNVSSVDPYVFKYNTKLAKVDMSENRVSFERLKVFLISQSIETLVLTGNRIERLYEVNLMGLSNLRNLVLDRNSLLLISTNSFRVLGELQYLSLANTGVCHLTVSMFNANLPRIIDIHDTCLAKKFDPPLGKVANNAVGSLLKFNSLIVSNPDTVNH